MIKVNYQFYKEDNFYNDDIYKAYESEIEAYINKYRISEYQEIIKKDKRTNIVNIFSDIRCNIVKWYPFRENKTLLEIGANYGELTGELIEKKLQVTSLEFTQRKAEIISKRYEKIDENLNIMCGNLKDIKFDKKYDYITIIGVAEYAKELGFKDVFELIKFAQGLLSEKGKILIGMDNKFAAKYLAGSTRNNKEVVFANYKEYVEKKYKLYGKYEIEEKLKEIGCNDYKFYYPVPDYKLTNLIYTDDYIPKENSSKISYNIYYREDEEILFNELAFINEVIKNNKFDFFANSYLIEIGSDITKTKFVNFSNMRKNKYKIITKMEKEFYKMPYSEKSIKHIKNIGKNIKRLVELGFITCDTQNENEIESKYMSYQTYDIYLANTLEFNQNVNIFKERINDCFKYIEQRLEKTDDNGEIFEKYDINISEELKEKLHFVKDGFIDLVFQNIFFDEKNYIIFDQEWYEENMPIEYIKYRSIEQLYFYNKNIEKYISKEEVYKYIGIQEYLKIFQELEKKWQDKIVNSNIIEFYNQKCSRIISIEDIKFNYNQQLGDLYQKKYEINEELEKSKKRELELKQTIEDRNILKKIFRKRGK